MKKIVILVLTWLCVFGCSKNTEDSVVQPVRGLKTLLIGEQQNSLIRRYPSVLQPSESSILSFQISGQINKLNLKVGQSVKAGDVVAELDSTSLKFAVQEAKAALDEATAAESNARKELERNKELKLKGLIGQATLDNSETSVKTLAAKTIQIRNKYAVAKDNLAKAQLVAPFDGIINSVSAEAFDTVAAGNPIANIYSPQAFEARFSASNLVVSNLALGSTATITLADFPDIQLEGRVTELAESTDVVSSFPVVVGVAEPNPKLKAGLAVEVSMEFAVTEGDGYPIPLTAVLVDGIKVDDRNADIRTGLPAEVFVFNEANSTVEKREVILAGVRSNQVIVTSGLNAGDRIAVAGVTFLREGQRVKLLETL